MKELLILLGHLLTTVAKLLGPGGAKAVVADNLLMKQQLLAMNRSRKRAPNLTALDRFLLGFWSLFLSPRHIQRAALIIRPSTLLKFHRLLKQRKYRLLYSPGTRSKPGPKGPSPELIQAIVELKKRNPRFGCPRIAQEINKAFGLDVDKDQVSLRSRDAKRDIRVDPFALDHRQPVVPRPSRSPALRHSIASLAAGFVVGSRVDWTPRLDAIFASPLALRTTGNQYRLVATSGTDKLTYAPLRIL